MFDKAHAWIDILLSCNHADKKVFFNGSPIIIQRGQWLTSTLNLSGKWGWSRHKVSTFLKTLENDNMILTEKDNKRTLITVVNYSVYQDADFEVGHQTDIDGTSRGHQKDTNNNDKNDKNDNKDIYINNIKYIVEFLNQVCGTHYKASTDNTKKHIRARLCEGYTVEDFKTVITKKHNEWKDNPKMVKYLRPDTLFGSKFESYLNQIDKGVKQSDRRMADTITGDAERDREIEEYLKSDEFLTGDDESLF